MAREYNNCGAQGKSIFQTHPSHKVTEQYRALAREIETRLKLFSQTAPVHGEQANELREVEKAIGNG
jgi:nitrogenase subunit NifH